MSRTLERAVLLGPQRPPSRVAEAAGDAIGSESVACITAGWQELEAEQHDLQHALAGRTENLLLYGRAERVWRSDPELAAGHKAMGTALRQLRSAYNVRLAHLMTAYHALAKVRGDESVLGPEREAALEAVRQLDEHHVRRVEEIRGEYAHRYRPHERLAVTKERGEIERILRGKHTVLVAGGHIAVLLNRMRLFGVADLLGGKSVIAWAAGAMALSSRIVLFHDRPPQGPGHPEAMENGLGLVPGVVALPDGDQRLELGDRARMARLARRFGHGECVVLGEGDRVEWSPREGWIGRGARVVTHDGDVVPWRAA